MTSTAAAAVAATVTAPERWAWGTTVGRDGRAGAAGAGADGRVATAVEAIRSAPPRSRAPPRRAAAPTPGSPPPTDRPLPVGRDGPTPSRPGSARTGPGRWPP